MWNAEIEEHVLLEAYWRRYVAAAKIRIFLGLLTAASTSLRWTLLPSYHAYYASAPPQGDARDKDYLKTLQVFRKTRYHTEQAEGCWHWAASTRFDRRMPHPTRQVKLSAGRLLDVELRPLPSSQLHTQCISRGKERMPMYISRELRRREAAAAAALSQAAAAVVREDTAGSPWK